MADKNNILSETLLRECIQTIRLVAFDFDGVFTDNSVYVLEDGSEGVICHRGDGIGLSKLKRNHIETVIISSEINPVVSKRSQKLRIRCIQGCEDKCAELEAVVQSLGISLKQVAFVGNDINDLPCLKSVGLPIVVRDAHIDVIPYAKYRTRTRGGHGAVREVCDLFDRVIVSK